MTTSSKININISHLKSIISIETPELQSFLLSKNPIITDGENYFFFAGNKSDIVLVAHIDTVKRNNVSLILENGVLKNNNDVLGADDRAGVYALLLLHEAIGIPIILFNYEEIGGLGVKKFCEEHIDAFSINSTKLFIELDRKGTNNFVSYNDLPKEIEIFLTETIGIKMEYGSYSDVRDLTKAFNIPSINLATGYYKEHTAKEHLNIKDYVLSINVLLRIIRYSNNIPRCLNYKDTSEDYMFNYYTYKYYDKRTLSFGIYYYWLTSKWIYVHDEYGMLTQIRNPFSEAASTETIKEHLINNHYMSQYDELYYFPLE